MTKTLSERIRELEDASDEVSSESSRVTNPRTRLDIQHEAIVTLFEYIQEDRHTIAKIIDLLDKHNDILQKIINRQ